MGTLTSPSVTIIPVDFLSAVAEHCRRFLRKPGDLPTVVVGNAALMCAAWFLLPRGVQAWLFALHGPAAFPVVLAAWMIADTPATNVLAGEGTGTAALAGAASCRRWLLARSGAIGLLVGLPCVVAAVATGILYGQWVLVVLACLAIVVAPYGVLPLAAGVGLLLPYRQRPLAWRWTHRRPWPSQLRWVALVLAPYVVVPALGALLAAPAVVVELARAARPADLSPSDAVLVGATLLATTLVAMLVGTVGAGILVDRRRDRITAFLADPHAG